jgi:Caspase domain
MNADASGALYALLIGIDNYPNNPLPDGTRYPPLGGCVRDIKHVEAFLLDRLAIPASNISKLTATRGPGGSLPEPDKKRPTYQNIVDKFKQLTDKAQSGDRIYIHYCGHGGRTRTASKNIKGEDGVDEGLVPYDIANYPDARYVRDIEIAHLLKAMVDKGLVVTLVLDCCHSGGATRGVGTATARCGKFPAGYDTREPPKDSAVAPLEELTKAWTGSSRNLARGVTAVGDWLSETRGYTLLAACRANEEAYEDSFDGKEKNGALTYWLLDSMRSMQPNTTYKDLHDRILAKIRSWMENQTPQLEGEGDILVFGTSRITPVYAIPILAVDAGGKRVKLNAGEVHGLSVGTLLAAYPPGEHDLVATEKRRALLEVTQLVGDADSWASITKDYGNGPIEQGGQAVLLGSTDLRMQRVVGVVLKDAALRQAVETAIAGDGTGFIRVQQGNESVDFQVALNQRKPNEYEIWDRAGVAVPNLSPAIPTTQADAAQRIVQRLVHLAKYRKIQELANPDPLTGKVKVELVDVLPERMSGTVPVFLPGDRLKVKITNTNEPNPDNINDKTRILNITVLDLAPDWQIQQALPAGAGAFEILQPGKSIELPIEAYLPDGYEESTDILKVFATQRTSGFRCLELPALDQPPATRGAGLRSQDPLESLLETFTDPAAPTVDELRSRSLHFLERKEDSAWAVAQVEVRVKKTP